MTTVSVKSKTVIKAFLESNFGTPVMIPEDHPLSTLINSQLTKENPRYNRHDDYADIVEIGITKETFRFDGFHINEANTQTFNRTVDKYMKNKLRDSIDALLIAQDEQTNWKEKCFDLLDKAKEFETINAKTSSAIRAMKRELEEHSINIKKAIEMACKLFLKMEVDLLGYEAVKKDYYRYRKKKSLRQMSSTTEGKLLRQMSSNKN